MLIKEKLTYIKRITSLLFLLFVFVVIPADKACASTIFTIGSAQYVNDRQVIQMDVAPYIKAGRTFLPVRFVANALGIPDSDITYDSVSRAVVLVKGTRVVQLKIGSKIMLVNNEATVMDVAPEIKAGRTCLPVSWIAKTLDANVTWDAVTQTVTLDERFSVQLTLTHPGYNTQTNANVVPSLQYDNIEMANKDLLWQYNGENYTWHVEVPSDLLEWDRKQQNYTADFFSGDYSRSTLLASMSEETKELVFAETDCDFTPWVNEANNAQWVGYMADALDQSATASGYDYFHEAEFILSFVGSAIPYNLTEYPELPAQTLIDSGDCKDKSILYAAILKSLGYKTVLLYFPAPAGETVGHMAVGIQFDDNQIPPDRDASYYPYNGAKYYFAETTSANWLIGQISDKELESEGYIYPN